MSEWLPIETAPRNGTMILVYRPDSKRGDAYIPRVGTDIWKVSRECWWHSNHWSQPTHWMPLPEPPK